MKRTSFLIFLTLMLLTQASRLQAQLIATDGGAAAYLVQDILLGEGVTAFNFSYTGAALAKGSFVTGSNPTNLGITSGVMLTSGLPTNAIGPNNSPNLGTFSFPQVPGHGDPDLDMIINNPLLKTYDACILEFDFIPQFDTIRFRFAFGSEEYNEFVGSNFNDVFGFFLSGPDISDVYSYAAKNIALLPNNITPVAINSINNGSSGSGPCNNCAFYVNNPGGATIQYDGFTTVLTAWSTVMPCNIYHIKLAIADVGDNAYDSGVFLEAGSFGSEGVESSISYTDTTQGGNTAIEGCVDALLTFKLPYPTTFDYNIIFDFLPSSTATCGVDYNCIQSPLTIPIGSDSGSIVIHPFLDGIAEGTEVVGIWFNTDYCGNEKDTVYFNISDYLIPQLVASPDVAIACGDETELTGLVSQGLQPYSYAWSDGASDSANLVDPIATSQFFITVTDGCNYSAVDSVTVSVYGPFANAGPDTAICASGTANLTASGGTSYLWSNGATVANIQVSPLVTTAYIVTVTATCFDVDTVVVTVHPLPVVTITPTLDSICPGTSTQLVANSGGSYAWSSTPADLSLASQDTLAAPVVSPATQTLYSLAVTNSYGC